jgi:hypothetical protein
MKAIGAIEGVSINPDLINALNTCHHQAAERLRQQ